MCLKETSGLKRELGSRWHLDRKKRVLCVCNCRKVRPSPVQSVICFQGSRQPTGNGSHSNIKGASKALEVNKLDLVVQLAQMTIYLNNWE